MPTARSRYGVPTRVSGDAQVGATGAIHVWGVLLISGAAAASTLALFNSADGSGTSRLDFAKPTGQSELFDFSEVGGVPFPTALYANIGGSGAIAYIWFEQ